MSNETLAILTAPELIAVNQDPLMVQAVVAAEFGAPSVSFLAALSAGAGGGGGSGGAGGGGGGGDGSDAALVASGGGVPGGSFTGPLVGVPVSADPRRCGTCCTGSWPGDTSSALCAGADADGQLALPFAQVSARCAADSHCAGFGNMSAVSAPGPAAAAFEPPPAFSAAQAVPASTRHASPPVAAL